MALLLKDEDIGRLAPMAECVAAMEVALREHAEGRAFSNPRRAIQAGSVAQLKTSAYRLSRSAGGFVVRGTPRRPGGAAHREIDTGLVVLFDSESGELAGIMPQFTLSGIRVGATTAVAVEHLAREDARVVGVFGTSKVARADLEGAACVRPLQLAKVYSPNPDHRQDFATEMSARLGIEVRAAATAREVVAGSDIVLCSTNSYTPVFDGAWAEPGQLITTTQSTPRPRPPLGRPERARYKDVDVIYRTDVDRAVLVRADAVCVLNEEMLLNEQQREILDVIEDGRVGWDKVFDLGEVLAGRAQARKRREDLVFYSSTGGMGIQMAAAGAVALRNAREQGVGLEISSDWFTADKSAWHRKGFYPTG